MEKLVELWYKIPREREWWIDQISALLSGCATGCFTLTVLYVLTVVGAIGVSFVTAKDAAEAFTLGLAWGTSLFFLTGSIFGSGFLALYSRYRES